MSAQGLGGGYKAASPDSIQLVVRYSWDWSMQIMTVGHHTLCDRFRLPLPSLHRTKSPSPSPSIFAYLKQSNTGRGEGLGTRLLSFVHDLPGPSCLGIATNCYKQVCWCQWHLSGRWANLPSNICSRKCACNKGRKGISSLSYLGISQLIALERPSM